jgi:hypothetical protein
VEQWVRCSGAALFKVAWEYNKSKHEVDLTVEQVVPAWRASDDASGHASHQGCFQGLVLIRIVEVSAPLQPPRC